MVKIVIVFLKNSDYFLHHFQKKCCKFVAEKMLATMRMLASSGVES
jgi:hypothetical protein